jgi:hypothetical protein
VPKADPVQRAAGGQPPPAHGAAAVQQAERDVVHRVQVIEQEELLEHEPQPVPAHRGQLGVGQRGHLAPGDPDHAAGRFSSVPRTCSRVDLPEPDGPRTASRSPG